MPHRVIETPDDLADLTRFFGNLKLPFTVEWTKGRERSLDQNRLLWLWCSEIAEQSGDRTPEEVQHELKLRHGVPILREDSAEFRAFYDHALKGYDYETKVEAMRFVPITSVMKVRQMTRFLDRVQQECAEHGLVLTQPDERLAAYMSRYRDKAEVA